MCKQYDITLVSKLQGAFMEPSVQSVEHRVKEALLQLTNEFTIFERLMYKSVNQHRRALYFRRLCQVRRDLRLLQLAKLTELIQNILHYLENNSRKSSLQEGRIQLQGAKLDVLDKRRRLYGVMRLLEQMHDPVLNASLHVAGLLGRTFFMPFALTTLSILARIRVLVLQCLHDVSTIFNILSEWASKQELIDHNLCTLPIAVNCEWDGTKLSLLATTTHHQHESANQGFVEDERGRKYTIVESLVLGATAAENDDTPNEDLKEIMQSLGPTSMANEVPHIGSDIPTLAVEEVEYKNTEPMAVASLGIGRRDTTNNAPTSVLEDQLPPNQGTSILPSQSPCENKLKTGNDFVSAPKKVAYVSVLSTSNLEGEKKCETPPLKKQKKDSLFDMLLGLGDDLQNKLL